MMSKHSKFATISVAVFVGLLAVYLGGYQNGKNTALDTNTHQATLATPETPTLAQTAQPHSDGEQSATEVAVIHPDDIDPASIDWEQVRQSRDARGHWDPMIRADLVGMLDSHDFTATEIAAYNKLHVVPFRPVVSDYCRDNKGAMIPGETMVCELIYETEEPYAGVNDDDLAALAYNDSVAAALMSRRSLEPNERYRWALRAIALSGKSGPALWVAEYNHVSTHYVDPISNEQKPATREIFARYVLERLAADLDDPRARPNKYEQLLRTAFAEDAEKAVVAAEERLQMFKHEINNVRQSLSIAGELWRNDS